MSREQVILELNSILAEVLNIAPVSNDANLFEEGMDSLLFVELLVSMEERFRLQVPFEEFDLDQFQTVNSITEFLISQDPS